MSDFQFFISFSMGNILERKKCQNQKNNGLLKISSGNLIIIIKQFYFKKSVSVNKLSQFEWYSVDTISIKKMTVQLVQ